MTCIWNENLHRWRVNRSNKYHRKQFLYLDHWIQNPKSREHSENTWFVVGLRIGPVTASLKKLTDLKLKDNSHLILWSKHVHPQIDTQRTKDFHLWRTACTEGTCHHIKGHMAVALINQLKSIKHKLEPFHTNAFRSPYIPRNYESRLIQWLYWFHLHLPASTMDTSQDWTFAHEYSIWNAAVTALGFRMADCEPRILRNAIDQVHGSLFYTQHMQSLPEEALIGC